MFIRNKYTKWYINIIRKAQNEIRAKGDGEYYERHHIIPNCMGGKQTVLLTAKEHMICHLLLPFMLTGQNRYKMINALNAMRRASQTQKRYTSKNYAIIRKLVAERNSQKFKGIKKPKGHGAKVSAARIGMKFTNTHRENISKAQTGKRLGKDNPFYGRKHSDIVKENISKKTTERLKGNKHTKGKIWCTNGVKCIMCYPNEIPETYVRGRKIGTPEKKSPA